MIYEVIGDGREIDLEEERYTLQSLILHWFVGTKCD